MKSLYTLLAFTLLFIASCGTSSDNGENNPNRIGTWEIQSQTAADWVGTQGIRLFKGVTTSGVGDTVSIENPLDQSLKATLDTLNNREGRIFIFFTDSTLTFETGVNLGSFRATTNDTSSTKPLDYLGRSVRFARFEDGIDARLTFMYNGCNGNEVSDLDTLYASFDDTLGNHLKTYQINTVGMDSTLKSIACF